MILRADDRWLQAFIPPPQPAINPPPISPDGLMRAPSRLQNIGAKLYGAVSGSRQPIMSRRASERNFPVLPHRESNRKIFREKRIVPGRALDCSREELGSCLVDSEKGDKLLELLAFGARG